MSVEQFITVELNLPKNANELSMAEEAVDKLKERFKALQANKNINSKSHEALFEDTIKVLDYVGKLSVPALKVNDCLEELYLKKFIHAPQLAKQLWLEHYEHVNHPYNILKNRCFRLLEELDEEFINVHKKFPPNWNI